MDRSKHLYQAIAFPLRIGNCKLYVYSQGAPDPESEKGYSQEGLHLSLNKGIPYQATAFQWCCKFIPYQAIAFQWGCKCKLSSILRMARP